MTEPTAEKREFKTEVSQLLDLVVHSLYSHKDIFLRELISNASDAIDKVRYQALTETDIAGDDTNWKITITADKEKNTLTLSDNGIGMTHDDLVNNLGTIAKSGTKEFLATLQQNKDDVNLIGQFGVGFYASFMVADKVAVVSKSPHGDAHRWISDGKQGFEITPDTKTSRGTDVILYLNEESKSYLEEYELRNLVKKYSDFVEFPIMMDIEREEVPKDSEGKPIEGAQPEKKITTETLNSMKAIWAKPKNDVTTEEYHEFYKHISHDFTDPLEIIHYHAEGTIEFKALIYIPSQAPFDMFMRDGQKGIQLYINRVFIMSDAKKLIPAYLRFIKGVVDTNDLPLNVSREILQQDTQLEKISKNIVKKTLSTLKTMKEKDFDKYLKFYKTFGAVLKEGLHYDHDNREAIAELLLFESTKTEPGQFRSLDQYIADMPSEQSAIYYHASEDRTTALATPYLETFQSKNWEVFLMVEPIDEIVLPDLFEYKQKPVKPINRGDVELSGEEKEKAEAEQKKANETYKDLLTFIQKKLDSDIKEVRFSKLLKDSPACLAMDDAGMTRQMQELFKSMGKETPPQKNILELNPNHKVVETMNSLFQENQDSEKLFDYISLVYDQSLLTAGFKIKDPLAFSKRVTQLMVGSSKK